MTKKYLEEEIEELEALDRLRIKSAEIRDQGRKSLRKVEEGRDDKEGWYTKEAWPGQPNVVKALCDRQDGPLEEMVKNINRQTAAEILNAEILQKPERLPILWAARSMQALAAAPDSSFTEALLAFYYLVVRELYTADAPDWRIGGARAAEGGSASAYMTGECVRAILSFVRTLQNTGALVEEVRTLRERNKHLEKGLHPRKWREMDKLRLVRDFYTSVVPLLDNIAFELDLHKPSAHPAGKAQKGEPFLLQRENVENFLEKVPEQIRQVVEKTVRTFEAVEKEVRDRRSEEPRQRESARRRYERSETGHAVALGAIQQGLQHAREALQIFARYENDYDQALRELAQKFRLVAERVRRLIRPAESFLSSVLDQELTAASSEARPGWDPAEMAFAAASYGYAVNSWGDDRLRRAGLCLSEELSERGRFRSGRPIYLDSRGNHQEVLGAEVLRSFAQLLENVEAVPVNERLVKSMLLFFDDTQRRFKDQDHVYWCPEQVQEPPKAIPGITALSVLALDRVNRMLDARINTRVFQHFSVKEKEDLKNGLSLRSLFYPDYGLRYAKHLPQGKEDLDWREEETVALTLEKMRTHVLGLSRREKTQEPLFSLILHGPPGTGKTTFVEALATSAQVPLVEITPSDIVSSGAEAVERRARAVFKALSLLTRVVILFDEFDPVLKRRDPDAPGPSTVFSFVTPGMLPKLKTLHDTAKKRGVAYTLITNLIGSLDPAAIRSGRFDRKLGIYPPDPLSQQGRLLDEALAFQRKTKCDLPDLEEKVRQVVQRTAGAPLGNLARKSWFVQPNDPESIAKESPFDYLVNKVDLSIESSEPEARPDPPPQTRNSTEPIKAAEREFRQWTWIQDWDERIREAEIKDLEDSIETPPSKISGHPSRKSPELYLSLGPKALEGFPSILIQVLSENGDSKSGGPGPGEPAGPATTHPD